jgi:hypothetical protein
MMLQLNPPLPMETPKGRGWAHFVIDYGAEGDLLWAVFMNEDGACWVVPNHEVRMEWNWTLGRRKAEDGVATARRDVSRAPQPFRPTLAHPPKP